MSFGAIAALAAGSTAGSFLTGQQSKSNAKAQRRWAARQYAQRYQVTMADMRKAGLNPILAYQTGVGSVPGGAMAQAPDYASAMSAGLNTATNISKAKPQMAAAKAAAFSSQASGEASRAQALSTNAITRQTGLRNQILGMEVKWLETPEGQKFLRHRLKREALGPGYVGSVGSLLDDVAPDNLPDSPVDAGHEFGEWFKKEVRNRGAKAFTQADDWLNENLPGWNKLPYGKLEKAIRALDERNRNAR